MKPENKAFLEANRHHWITLRDAQYCRHLDGNTREGMRRVMSEEFQPGYSADLWCPPCVVEMVKSLYRHYDDWLARQGEPAAPIVDEVISAKTAILEGLIKIPRIDVVREFGHDDKPATEAIVITHEEQKAPEEKPAPVQVKASFPNHKQNRRR